MCFILITTFTNPWVEIWHNAYTKKVFINLIGIVGEGERGKLPAFLLLKYYLDLLSIIKYLNHYTIFLNRNQQLQFYLKIVIHVTHFRYNKIQYIYILNKIILTKKINACFLAIVLIAGTFALSSPLTVYGQEYEQDYQEYYKTSYYPSEPPVMDDSQSVKPSQKANCDNNNVNINDIEQKQSQRQAIDSTLGGSADDGITGQELTSEEALNALTGNGDPLVNIDRNILNVCFNGNDNTLTGLFSANQGQTGTTITCEECFEENLTPEQFAALNAILENQELFSSGNLGINTSLSLEKLCTIFTIFSEEEVSSAVNGVLQRVNAALPTEDEIPQSVIEDILQCVLDVLANEV